MITMKDKFISKQSNALLSYFHEQKRHCFESFSAEM